MEYRNKKTGALIRTDCTVSGGDWEPVPTAVPETEDEREIQPEDETEAAPPSTPPKRAGGRKKP